MATAVLLWLLLLLTLCAVVGYCSLAASGLLLRLRLGRHAPRLPCLPAPLLATVAAAALLLAAVVLSRLPLPTSLPWRLVPLLVSAAPLLFFLLGPPRAHVDGSQQRHVGTYNAWSHYYGYLSLFRDNNSPRQRLQNHKDTESVGDLYGDAVVVLWPLDGHYPEKYSELPGISEEVSFVQGFQQTVAGNRRTYARFGVHGVEGSDGRRRTVALDRVSALATLRQMAEFAPVGMRGQCCQQQMHQMLVTMRHIIRSRRHLRGQVRLVTYGEGDHVADRILEELAASQ